MSLAQANQKLVQAANNPAVSPADRQRCLNALVVANENSRPKAQRSAVGAPVDLRGMSPEAILLSVISDPQNSPAEKLQASHGLAEYYRDREIPPHLLSQFEAASQAMADTAEQQEYLARRCGA
jgi:hypothetical protein